MVEGYDVRRPRTFRLSAPLDESVGWTLMESGAQAVLATLAYRLVSYWLPFIAGAVAY
jgi:hypothetical protein